MQDVIIIGGGLAGLTCARELQLRGIPFVLLEKSDRVGGRVRTDKAQGFLLDRGFQVMLTAYPEPKRWLDFSALKLRDFEPGAFVRWRGKFHHVADPLRAPKALFESLFSPIGTLIDQVRMTEMAIGILRSREEDLLRAPEATTEAWLHAKGLGPAIVERFLRPFFGGVFLESELQTSSRKFEFLFRMFATGKASIPADGMEAIPRELASPLPREAVIMESKVTAIDGNIVYLESGGSLEARAVVIATDPGFAARLLNRPAPRFNGTSCMQFAAENAPEEVPGPVLVLNGDGEGPINNLAVMSNVAPSYAPAGAALITVSTVGRSLDATEADVCAQLKSWFGSKVGAWRLLARYNIPEALPSQSPNNGGVRSLAPKIGERLYVAGDWCDLAGSHGAMISGRRAAEAVAVDLGA